MMEGPPSLSVNDFVQGSQAWIETDPLVCRLKADSSLDGIATLSQSLDRLSSPSINEPGTLEFLTEASFKSLGVTFTVGKHYKRSFYDPKTQTVICPCFFLPQSAADADSQFASRGCAAAALDEVFGALAIARGGGSFTASLTIQHHSEVRLSTTLLMTAKVLTEQVTSKGTQKYWLEGELREPPAAPADPGKLLVTTQALFIRPATNPLQMDRHALYSPSLAKQPQRKRELMEAMVAKVPAAELQAAAAARAAALDSIRTFPGSPSLLTHCPDFDAALRQWVETDLAARDAEVRGAEVYRGAMHLQGKIFLAYSFEGLSNSLKAAARFLCVAEGPPSSAHGGSIFALFEHLCSVFLRRIFGVDMTPKALTVQYKARLPLDATARLHVQLQNINHLTSVADKDIQLSLAGSLHSADGATLHDTMEAVVVIDESLGTKVHAIANSLALDQPMTLPFSSTSSKL
eukprot:gnl/TRDRNA2_/TRDRNA2_126667_c0_seq1.p1 gnl/TRDRNA2_/TRDRNA2_126667_c0~~gnl/TRDRNA2_/TRDRNA2_126667_c0_seq1.p1  ORF type:complete len:462 (-),score=73.51 gnl/TRDRNA2_/TRDRNA2_126667_c0_seq1:103-1488(-)